jgi:phage shock protein PspC (stress-responsive transcriptional regulator)
MSTESAHTEADPDPQTGPESQAGPGTGGPYGFGGPGRPIFRPRNEGMLTGTAAGIASYLGIDPTIARVGFVALCLMGGAGLPLYLAAWLLIPEEGSDHSIGAHLLELAKTAFGATYPA